LHFENKFEKKPHMSLLANIVLALAAALYFLILSAAYGKAPSSSGDAAVGYAMSMFLLFLVFTGLMVLVAAVIGWKGAFGWVHPHPAARFALVALGILAIAGVAGLSAALRFEPPSQQPLALRYLTGFGPAVLPLFLLFGAAVLLNDPLRNALPALAYKAPLGLAFWLSVLASGVGFVEWFAFSQRNAAERIAEIRSNEDRHHDMHLQDIEAADPMTNLVALLVFTGKYHAPDVREKALAKIKSNPDWQNEIARILDTWLYDQSLTFLESNEVDNPAIFPEAVNKGLLQMAADIRDRISKAPHLRADEYDWTVKRGLAVANKFQGMGVDFLPAVREVRAALDEPPQSHLKKVKYNCAKDLEQWIKNAAK
jgi:hypothetical protein